MNFQNLQKVEKADTYLDMAFKNSKQVYEKLRSKKYKDNETRTKRIELEKLRVFGRSLASQMRNILVSFPSINSLPEFYLELLKYTLDYSELKQSLGAVNWAMKKISEFSNIYYGRIKKCHMRDLKKLKSEYYGRISSVLKQIKKQLEYLEESRKTMKGYPAIKTSLFTVSIIGFPNVGKTTLLFKLTGSKPEINSYAFTTKTINVSYIAEENKKIQLLDTPGSLNRLEKMNNIEKQAYLAMKHSNLLVYVFDTTEPYPMEQQEALFKILKKFDKEVLIYLSKTDILDKKDIAEFEKKHKNLITNIDELKERLFSLHAPVDEEDANQ